MDVAAEQPEPAVDVADEGLHEAVDDAEIIHGGDVLFEVVLRGGTGGWNPAPQRAATGELVVAAFSARPQRGV